MAEGHTPRPWLTSATGITGHGRERAVVTDNEGMLLADCGFGSSKVAMANARLIAAAPELLAIVNALVDWYDEHDGREGPHAGAAFDRDRTWNDAVHGVLGKL